MNSSAKKIQKQKQFLNISKEIHMKVVPNKASNSDFQIE